MNTTNSTPISSIIAARPSRRRTPSRKLAEALDPFPVMPRSSATLEYQSDPSINSDSSGEIIPTTTGRGSRAARRAAQRTNVFEEPPSKKPKLNHHHAPHSAGEGERLSDIDDSDANPQHHSQEQISGDDPDNLNSRTNRTQEQDVMIIDSDDDPDANAQPTRQSVQCRLRRRPQTPVYARLRMRPRKSGPSSVEESKRPEHESDGKYEQKGEPIHHVASNPPPPLQLRLRLRPPNPHARTPSRTPQQCQPKQPLLVDTLVDFTQHINLENDNVLPSLRLWDDISKSLYPYPVPLTDYLRVVGQNSALSQYVGQENPRFPHFLAGCMLSGKDADLWTEEFRKPGRERKVIVLNPAEIMFVSFANSLCADDFISAMTKAYKEVPAENRNRIYLARFTDFRGLRKGVRTYVLKQLENGQLAAASTSGVAMRGSASSDICAESVMGLPSANRQRANDLQKAPKYVLKRETVVVGKQLSQYLGKRILDGREEEIAHALSDEEFLDGEGSIPKHIKWVVRKRSRSSLRNDVIEGRLDGTPEQGKDGKGLSSQLGKSISANAAKKDLDLEPFAKGACWRDIFGSDTESELSGQDEIENRPITGPRVDWPRHADGTSVPDNGEIHRIELPSPTCIVPDPWAGPYTFCEDYIIIPDQDCLTLDNRATLPKEVKESDRVNSKLPREPFLIRKPILSTAFDPKNSNNATTPAGLDNEPLVSKPYSTHVYVWDYEKKRRTSDVLPVLDAIALVCKQTNLGIYDGQDFNFQNGKLASKLIMFPYDYPKWEQRDSAWNPAQAAKARVRVWDPSKRAMRKMHMCPMAYRLAIWLELHREYAVFVPSMLDSSCRMVSDNMCSPEPRAIEEMRGLRLPPMFRSPLITCIRELNFANINPRTMLDLVFWNSFKKCKESFKPFRDSAELLLFWLTNPWLQLYRGQDEVKQFELHNGFRFMPILTNCPAALASFWDKASLQKVIQPKGNPSFANKTIYECISCNPDLELYIGQDTPHYEYFRQTISNHHRQSRFPYSYMLAYSGKSACQFFKSSNWVAMHIDTERYNTSCAVFWDKRTKTVEMQPDMAAFVSIGDYLSQNSSSMELYVGQDLNKGIAADISKWFSLLAFKPGYAAECETPMLTKTFFLPMKTIPRGLSAEDVSGVNCSSRMKSRKSNALLHENVVQHAEDCFALGRSKTMEQQCRKIEKSTSGEQIVDKSIGEKYMQADGKATNLRRNQKHSVTPAEKDCHRLLDMKTNPLERGSGSGEVRQSNLAVSLQENAQIPLKVRDNRPYLGKAGRKYPKDKSTESNVIANPTSQVQHVSSESDSEGQENKRRNPVLGMKGHTWAASGSEPHGTTGLNLLKLNSNRVKTGGSGEDTMQRSSDAESDALNLERQDELEIQQPEENMKPSQVEKPLLSNSRTVEVGRLQNELEDPTVEHGGGHSKGKHSQEECEPGTGVGSAGKSDEFGSAVQGQSRDNEDFPKQGQGVAEQSCKEIRSGRILKTDGDKNHLDEHAIAASEIRNVSKEKTQVSFEDGGQSKERLNVSNLKRTGRQQSDSPDANIPNSARSKVVKPNNRNAHLRNSNEQTTTVEGRSDLPLNGSQALSERIRTGLPGVEEQLFGDKNDLEYRNNVRKPSRSRTRRQPIISKSNVHGETLKTKSLGSLNSTNCSEDHPSEEIPGPTTKTRGSKSSKQPDPVGDASGAGSLRSDDVDSAFPDVGHSSDARVIDSRLERARRETYKMANLIKTAGPKVLHRQLVQDIRQSLREELLLEVPNSGSLLRLSNRLRSLDFLLAAEELCDRLEALDVTGCFSDAMDFDYGPPDLCSIREDLMSGKLFTIVGIIERFRMLCGDLRQFHQGCVLQFEASLLKKNGEEVIRSFVRDNQELVKEEERISRVCSICQKAQEIGFQEGLAAKKTGKSARSKTPSNAKPTIRVSNQSEVTYLNYRDEKGHSVMGKRHSARVFGLSIDRACCEARIGNVRPCHVCKKEIFQSDGDSLNCANRTVGLCDEVVCRECLELVFFLDEAEFIKRRQAGNWTCVHCRGLCHGGGPGLSKCGVKDGAKISDVKVLLTWPHNDRNVRSVTFVLNRRSIRGEFQSWNEAKKVSLQYVQNRWSIQEKLPVGVYRCQVQIEGVWKSSTVLYVLSQDRYDQGLSALRISQSMREITNSLPDTGVKEMRSLRRGLLKWSASSSTPRGPVHALSKSDGGVLVKNCSRTEGYDWKRSKRHSVASWIPERGFGIGERNGSGNEVEQIVRLSASCQRVPLTHRADFPKLKVGMAYKRFCREVVAFKFDYMFNEMLWGIVTGKSKIHGIGLFTLTGYRKGDYVIEYAGDLIRSPLGDIREHRYEAAGLGTYLFRLDDSHIVDATVNSNRARFTNHSCDPNMEADIVNVRGRDLVVLWATRDIPPYAELTFNYQLPYEDKKLQCLCNSWKCIGVMN